MLKARDVDPLTVLAVADERGFLRRSGALLRVPGAAWLEDQASAALLTMERREPSVTIPAGDELDTLVYDAESTTGIQLSDQQHAAVMKLLEMPVAALQGGAGGEP